METTSGIFPESLIFCRWAESSYLALKRFKKRISVGDRDKKAIGDAITFLENAKYGKKVIDSLELGQNALAASYAFKAAFSATLGTFQRDDREDIEQILDDIINLLKKVGDDTRISEKDLDNLISFFAHVRESMLASSAGAFDKFITWSNVNGKTPG